MKTYESEILLPISKELKNRQFLQNYLTYKKYPFIDLQISLEIHFERDFSSLLSCLKKP